MTLYSASIRVMPLKALLDPQGKAVTRSIQKMGLNSISQVRVGKHLILEIEASSEEEARSRVDEACKKLLCNPIMEFYEFDILVLKNN